ncbi:MAG TPA: ATP-binding protein [Streptosporangiaceae bacterium]|nr:ATP-binding protein [Streptosporangiaceae bacterium]
MAANLPAAAAPPVTARVFAGDAGQVRAARRFLAGLLDGCPAAGDAVLCVSELATNAVLHSRSGRPGGGFTVRATRQPGSARVEVTDEGGPWGHERDGDGQSGRGLLIVGELASRWGREDGAGRRTVWFELDW